MANIPQKPVINNQQWINGQTKLNQTNLTNGVNQNITNLQTAVDGIIDALGGEGSVPAGDKSLDQTNISAYSAGTAYTVGTLVIYNDGTSDRYYRCIKNSTGNAPINATYWAKVGMSTPVDPTLDENSTNPVQNAAVTDAINGLDGRLDTAEGDIDALEANVDKIFDDLAPEYSASSAYEIGDYCIHDGNLYKCAVKIASGEAWNAAHWEVANIGDDLKGKIAFGSGWFDGTGGVEYSEVAGNLVSTKGLTVNDDPMSYGIVGGAQKSAVGDGNASLNKLVCVDVVKNQQFNIDSTKTSTINGVTFTCNEDGTITCNGTATADTTFFFLYQRYSVVNGHIYFMHGCPIGGSGDTYSLRAYYVSGTETGNGLINSAPQSASDGLAYIQIKNGVTVNNLIFKPCLHNLTQRYGNNDVVNAIIGTGTDAEKVARLLAFDPEILSNLDYDAGTLVPSKTAKLLSVGVNQWDEEYELGGYSKTDGSKTTSSATIRSKNAIRVMPNTTYYLRSANSSNQAFCLFFYDANGNYIEYLDDKNNVTFTTPSNCCEVRFQGWSVYGTTYNNDICINISDPNINGKYYKSKRTPVTLPNYEGHGILKVVDGKVVADGTELYPDGNSKKRYGVVNMATLNWTAGSGYYSTSDLSSIIKIPSSQNYTVNLLSEKYENKPRTNFDAGVISVDSATTTTPGRILVGTSTSPTGYLVYPLATEEDIATTVFQSTFPVEQGGTLQFLDEDDNPIAGLQGSEIFYQKNIKAFVEALGEATDWDPDAIALVEDVVLKTDEMTDEELLTVQNIITGN